jgi:serine/threonine protein kinase
MENIRDRQVKNNQFTEGSDWFSFAVIAFNMLIGIHPYKGKHPSIRDWSERMDKNISVFDPAVSLPNVCLPFDVIPDNYLQWFKATFGGKRFAPPTGLHDVLNLVAQIKKVIGSNNFDIKEIFSAVSKIQYCFWGDSHVVITKDHGATINSKEVPEVTYNAKIVILPTRNVVVTASLDNGKVKLFNATTRADISFDACGSELMQSDNRLYVKSGAAIYEIKFLELGNKILPSLQQAAQCLELGSKLYDGVMVQNLLGATYVSFFPEPDKHYQLHIKELDQYRIIDAKYEKKVLMVIGYKNGKYDKLILRLSSTFEEYDVRVVLDVQYSGINFTVLDNKICVHITEEEKMEIFPAIRNQTQIKEIEDPILDGDMKLFSYGVQTFFSKEDKVYSIKTK